MTLLPNTFEGKLLLAHFSKTEQGTAGFFPNQKKMKRIADNLAKRNLNLATVDKDPNVRNPPDEDKPVRKKIKKINVKRPGTKKDLEGTKSLGRQGLEAELHKDVW